ncbi:MAG: triple tyrosine motif-containing protein [Paludibacter sp.]|nr:triple tyrosine motif-containing protein [Paludibacter sp.]
MKLSSRKYLLGTLIFISAYITGQEFTPIVNQFTKKEYHASNQNWSVGQGPDGIMYFGNNQGLLEFDGSMWQTHHIAGNKIVRSLLVSTANRIYTGSFEEFGYFEKNTSGQLKYHSLSAKLKKYTMQNDEIWNILDLNGTIIFQSFTSYFTYKNNQVTGIRCPYTFLFFNIYKQKIYTHTEQFGFSTMNSGDNSFVPVPNSIIKSPVISVLTYDRSRALLITRSDGLFLYDGTTISRFVTGADEELRKGEINRAVISPDGIIVLGTILNGVTAINRQGVKLWTLNTSNVLQNNTVLGMYCDRDNNLWLALDKGISLIRLNASIRYIRSFSPSVGSIYSLTYNEPNLYIGTNQGLYKAELGKDKKSIHNLQLEPNIKGQVWSVNQFDNQQLCGNNEATYDVSGKGINILSSVKGGICIKRGIIHGKDVLVQGTYTQLCIYEKVNGAWKFSHTVDNFVNPIRYIEIDYTGTIWASHLHQGLYAIQLTPDLHKIEHITTFNTLDRKHRYPINVFSINNRVVFTDNNAFYTYDDIQKKIIPFDELNKSLGYFAHAYRVCHFKSDLYWFILDGEAALVQVKPGAIKLLDVVQYALFLNQTVDEYQNIIPISETECIFTLENGLVLYNTDHLLAKSSPASLQIKSIQSSDAESRETGFLPLSAESVPSTPFKRNNLIFTVFYPQYTSLNNISFRYKLDGLDKVWSEPSASSQKVYSYLPHGVYTLNVEVMTKSGMKLSAVSYTFEVDPPFYLSVPAKILYILLFLMLGVGIYLYILRLIHLKKEKVRLEQEEIRRKEIEKREQQIIALQNEKLESELTVKSKELAVSTMTIIKKNEILATIKEEVVFQKNALGSQYPNKYYDKLIRLLDENLSSEDDWAIFQTNFDRIHENFFRNLHTRFPELTSNDLRFCAYLRLNLSSKDIAHLMNISLKGVEVGRYRVRKKIGIPSTKSLTEFMIEFK